MAIAFGIAILSAVSSGCDGAGDTGAEEVAQEALDSSYVSGPFHWDQSFLGPQQLKPSSSHVCVLAGGAGAFRGDGEVIWVYTDTDGFWYAGGRSQQQGVSAKAFCFDQSHFTGPVAAGASQPGRFVSGEVFVWAKAGPCSFFPHLCAFGYQQGSMWLGDAASFLTGMSGRFDGGGEFVQVEQSNDASTNSIISTQTSVQSDGAFIESLGYSFFVGVPGTGHAARFRGPNGVGTAGGAGEYSVASSGGTSRVFMAATNEAMCYVTRVSGEFRGASDSFDISPQFDANNVERWVLTVTDNSYNHVQARGRCFLFNQN